MTRLLLVRVLSGWALVTALGCVAVHQWTAIDPAPMPVEAAGRWAVASLEAAGAARPRPAPPAEAQAYRAAGPIFVIAWSRGLPVARHVGSNALVEAVDGAAQAFGDLSPGDAGLRYTVTCTLGEGPLWMGVPFVENLGVVPLHEGLHVRVDGQDAWVTPEELRATRGYDGGVPTPLPDLSFGVDVGRLVDRLAREIGFESSDVTERGSVTRLRAATIGPAVYPKPARVDEESLARAAVEGARFLLRHQRSNGMFTYVYDAQTGGARPETYNLPRHAGSTYFLAQIHNLHGLPEAREGARRALRWVQNTRIRHCGDETVWCVEYEGRVELGSSALTALAAAEYLAGGDDAEVRVMLERLTAFMRSMQRDDGELMHEYDLRAAAPIDVQYLYYSGETAFALLRAHEVLGDDRDLEVARGVMRHLTGAGWDFLGSRYYYGEEHWTCLAASAAADRIDMPEGLDFCRRWAHFNRQVQYGEGETPWPSTGAYGVGPLLLPRLTPVASRTEAFISTYEMSLGAGVDDPALRAQIEAGLGMLLRWRWDPGPTHLFAEPEGAQGGLPGSPVELMVRNDYVQHACSAMIRWADLLKREREREGAAR